MELGGFGQWRYITCITTKCDMIIFPFFNCFYDIMTLNCFGSVKRMFSHASKAHLNCIELNMVTWEVLWGLYDSFFTVYSSFPCSCCTSRRHVRCSVSQTWTWTKQTIPWLSMTAAGRRASTAWPTSQRPRSSQKVLTGPVVAKPICSTDH